MALNTSESFPQLALCARAGGLDLSDTQVRWSGPICAEPGAPVLSFTRSAKDSQGAMFHRALQAGDPKGVNQAVFLFPMPPQMLCDLAEHCLRKNPQACAALVEEGTSRVDARWLRPLQARMPERPARKGPTHQLQLHPGLLIDGLDVLVSSQSLAGRPDAPAAEVVGGSNSVFLRCQIPSLRVMDASTAFVVGNGRAKAGVAVAEVGEGCHLALVDHLPERFTRFSVHARGTVVPPPGWLLERTPENSQRLVRADESRLFASLKEGNLVLLEKLLQTGLDPGARDRIGYTPLFWAAQLGDTQAIALLLGAGANVNASGQSGLTALILAATFCQPAAAKALLEAGAHPQVGNADGQGPIHLAAARRDSGVLKVLLSAQVPTSERTPAGMTALMVAAREGHLENVRVLLQAGADVQVKNRAGQDALSLAREKERSEVVCLLESTAPAFPTN